MSAETQGQQSPLNQFYTRIGSTFTDDSAAVVLKERAFLSHLNLRGDPADAGFLSDTAAVLDFDLPTAANTWSGHSEARVCWLGPNEWLLFTTGDAQEWLDALRAANAERFIACTDVSGGQTVLRLSGVCARELLAKGCTLDFHPRAFAAGQCAQSVLGKAPALFVQIDETPVYELVVRRSFADYLGCWLQDAAHEFGLCVVR